MTGMTKVCISSTWFQQIADGVVPTLPELEKFEDRPEGMEVECILFTDHLIM